MARTATQKPSPENTPQQFRLPCEIGNPEQELFFLLGYLRGTDVSAADRITELHLTIVSALQAKIAEGGE